jgi:hypothetical protein
MHANTRNWYEIRQFSVVREGAGTGNPIRIQSSFEEPFFHVGRYGRNFLGMPKTGILTRDGSE